MSILGDDGRGFELARRLEALGVWRAWLGEPLYVASSFAHALSSPSSWESFMRSDEPSRPKAQIHLQLRARALLFDKASLSLFLPPNASSSSSSVSKLNPNYLQLHVDDVYFTLEDGDHRRDAAHTTPSKNHSMSGFGADQRFRGDELSESWYDQFTDKAKVNRTYRLSIGDRELDKRSPEEMSAYLRMSHKHKRRRIAFKQDQYAGYGNSGAESASNMQSGISLDASNSVDEEVSFFPETTFTWNCVPDSVIPTRSRSQHIKKLEIRGVLDTLPQAKSQVVIERLGISVEQRGKSWSEGGKKALSQEQALQISRKVVARMLARAGFESATEAPLDVFSQLMHHHISKLGHTLKVLSDSYRTQCSAVELLKMFLQSAGYSNLGSLMELVKDGTRTSMQPSPQQLYGVQSQFQPQHQAALRMQQQLQVPRQMHPQMQQMVHSQNLAFQQQQQQQQLQLERMRRRQALTPRGSMEMDKERPMVQVKLENPDMPMDTNAFNLMQSRQMQFRQQQQLAAMSNVHAQAANQLRQLQSSQITQMQSPNMGLARAPPVKVEGFQELMGGDSSSKNDSDENKLTSPLSR